MPASRSWKATIAATSRSPRPCAWPRSASRRPTPRPASARRAAGQRSSTSIMSLRIRPQPEQRRHEAALGHDRDSGGSSPASCSRCPLIASRICSRCRPAPLAEHHRLRQRRHLDPHQHVEHDLHRRAHAVGAHQGHLLADRRRRSVPAPRSRPRRPRPSPAAPRSGRGRARRIRRPRAPGNRPWPPSPRSPRENSGGTVLMSTT